MRGHHARSTSGRNDEVDGFAWYHRSGVDRRSLARERLGTLVKRQGVAGTAWRINETSEIDIAQPELQAVDSEASFDRFQTISVLRSPTGSSWLRGVISARFGRPDPACRNTRTARGGFSKHRP